MADTYEQNLTQKSSLTTSDYIRVVGSDNESYKQLVSDVAKKVIEVYTGSTLAGSAQSVKSAVDALNSKLGRIELIYASTLSSGGTYTTSALSAGMYLVMTAKYNSNADNGTGLFILSCYPSVANKSNMAAVLTPANGVNVTLDSTADNNTISIENTMSATYIAIRIYKL